MALTFSPIQVANPFASFDAGRQASQQNKLLELQQQNAMKQGNAFDAQAQAAATDAQRKEQLDILRQSH